MTLCELKHCMYVSAIHCATVDTPHGYIARKKIRAKILGVPISVVGAKRDPFGPYMPPKRHNTMPEGMTMVKPTESDPLM